MRIFRMVMELYLYHGLPAELFKNDISPEPEYINWNEPLVDFCQSMCCYAKIEERNGHRYCTKCGSRMEGS